nr:unnamed protein product [Digitaria exilis]
MLEFAVQPVFTRSSPFDHSLFLAYTFSLLGPNAPLGRPALSASSSLSAQLSPFPFHLGPNHPLSSLNGPRRPSFPPLSLWLTSGPVCHPFHLLARAHTGLQLKPDSEHCALPLLSWRARQDSLPRMLPSNFGEEKGKRMNETDKACPEVKRREALSFQAFSFSDPILLSAQLASAFRPTRRKLPYSFSRSLADRWTPPCHPLPPAPVLDHEPEPRPTESLPSRASPARLLSPARLPPRVRHTIPYSSRERTPTHLSSTDHRLPLPFPGAAFIPRLGPIKPLRPHSQSKNKSKPLRRGADAPNEAQPGGMYSEPVRQRNADPIDDNDGDKGLSSLRRAVNPAGRRWAEVVRRIGDDAGIQIAQPAQPYCQIEQRRSVTPALEGRLYGGRWLGEIILGISNPVDAGVGWDGGVGWERKSSQTQTTGAGPGLLLFELQVKGPPACGTGWDPLPPRKNATGLRAFGTFAECNRRTRSVPWGPSPFAPGFPPWLGTKANELLPLLASFIYHLPLVDSGRVSVHRPPPEMSIATILAVLFCILLALAGTTITTAPPFPTSGETISCLAACCFLQLLLQWQHGCQLLCCDALDALWEELHAMNAPDATSVSIVKSFLCASLTRCFPPPLLHLDCSLPSQHDTMCLERISAGGTFQAMAAHPDGSPRVFLSSREGNIWLAKMPRQGSGSALSPHLFLDLTDRVHNDHVLGLLGMAFHPEFATNGWFFLLADLW